MSGPIQTIPQGLLGLLQLKELGKNPAVLVDTVAPNIDLFQLYAQRSINGTRGLFSDQVASSALVNGNHGFQNLFTITNTVAATVPQGETWWVYQWSCDVVTLAAADTLSAAPALLSQSGRFVLVAPIYADVITARVRSYITAPILAPFWALPGSQFGVFLTDILTATSIQLFSEIRAVRVPI